MPEPQKPLHLCCLLWAHDDTADALTRYEDTVLDLLAEHGGAVVSRVIGAGHDGTPHEVQILSMADRDALDAYLADPRRVALADERDRAIARTDVFEVDIRTGGTSSL
ncbi:hypothetical protein [Gordonia sp. KTR9]|uniref:hypothetical protein n=1 Tax=Gordonia sp. KTR9 TaxID=337191 RepID=UPI0002E3BDA6|nr:hypothetical protein [Gordonia sp. KTR9]